MWVGIEAVAVVLGILGVGVVFAGKWSRVGCCCGGEEDDDLHKISDERQIKAAG